ncbi:MAG: alpha/beta fold hydrolase [bacterium]
MAKPRPQISQPIHPIEMAGGPKGVLLFHGFSATPECFRFLARSLNQAKFSVLAPVLAGHGTHVKDFEESHWSDWYRSAEEAYLKLKKHCPEVYVVGLSMGGLLALHLAHQHRGIKAIALLATPLFLDGWLIKYVFPLIWKTPLRHFYRYQNKYIVSIKDPLERRRHQTYEKIPVVSVANLLDLQKKVRRELGHIHQPAFIAHALDDTTVPYGNLDYIQACIGSDKVETLTLKRSNHIITMDYDREIVAKRVVKFFKKHD